MVEAFSAVPPTVVEGRHYDDVHGKARCSRRRATPVCWKLCENPVQLVNHPGRFLHCSCRTAALSSTEGCYRCAGGCTTPYRRRFRPVETKTANHRTQARVQHRCHIPLSFVNAPQIMIAYTVHSNLGCKGVLRLPPCVLREVSHVVQLAGNRGERVVNLPPKLIRRILVCGLQHKVSYKPHQTSPYA